jgi:glycosyltransferase involved in cell wall biosynthesis
MIRLIARAEVVDADGRRQVLGREDFWRKRKLLVAMVAAVTGRDYWQVRMLSGAVRQTAAAAAREDWDGVLMNFLYSTPLLSGWESRQVRLVVDTHNYDPGVFGGFRDAARNPLQRALCSRAIRTSERALSYLPEGTVMVHVSEADRESWRRDRGDLRHEVVENGCTVRPRPGMPDYGGSGLRRLLFVGSLSAQMNQNALELFAQRYWPALKGSAAMTVAGSGPSARVQNLCRDHGWTLMADITDEVLEGLYGAAHYALLPFGYGAGSKLKLFEACGRGVPVLGTRAGVTGVSEVPPLVMADDRVEAWQEAVARRRPPEAVALEETLSFARRFSWPALADRLRRIIESAPEVVIPRMGGQVL